MPATSYGRPRRRCGRRLDAAARFATCWSRSTRRSRSKPASAAAAPTRRRRTAVGRGGQIRGVLVTIDQKIPVEAGLGGGRADAAAALVALARLWGGAPMTLLREVGATIGADVPFFLSGGTALGLGRGEE